MGSPEKVNLAEKLALFNDHWHPRVDGFWKLEVRGWMLEVSWHQRR